MKLALILAVILTLMCTQRAEAHKHGTHGGGVLAPTPTAAP